MKNILFFVFLLFMAGLSSIAQDVNTNAFVFDNKIDTNQISWGMRLGRFFLTQPKTPKGISARQKRAYETFPEHIGVGNLIIDFRTRFARDTVSGVGHDGLVGFNLSLLRSRMFVGYQYNRHTWFVSGRIGLEVLRNARGVYQSGSKKFSNNILLVGSEFGYNPTWNRNRFRLRALVEYDFGEFGWYASALTTSRLVSYQSIRFDGGVLFDGIWGYGWYASASFLGTFVYLSVFEGQFPFQETRFPEQRIGMEKGFAIGLLTNLK